MLSLIRSQLLKDRARTSGCPFRIRHLDDVIESDVTGVRRKENEKTLRYEHFDKEQQNVVDQIIRGGVDLNKLKCQQAKVVRMFVCSSGPDFESERNFLFENIYPSVRQYCRSNYGIDFQLVDMLWGNPRLPSTDPKQMEYVYEELRHCQKISMGPNFVAFVGQKYGNFSLPNTIPTTDMEEILTVTQVSGHDDKLLTKWYQKDTNVNPNVYRFQASADTDLETDYENLVEMFQSASTTSDKLSTLYCNNSDFENLLREGLLSLDKKNADDNCLVYIRDIKNIDERLTAKNAGSFVDLEQESCTRNTEKARRINMLRDFVEESIAPSNMVKSEIELNGCALNEEKSGEYVTSIGRHFFSEVTRLVNKQMENREKIFEDSLINELTLHWGLMKNLLVHPGQDEVLADVRAYIMTDTDQPLVLVGETGCGKSSLIAAAANDINGIMQKGNLAMPTAIVTRFIGSTSKSEDVQQFLYYMCHQLAYITGRFRQDIPSDYMSLRNFFIDFVKRGEYGGMIVILLDSLEKISTTDNGHKLDWLPPRIASNIKIIVTVNTENENMVEKLDNMLDQGVIEIPKFSHNQSEDALKLQMKENKMTVNYNQWKRVQMALQSSSTPLLSELVFQEIMKWHSYDHVSENFLDQSIDDIISRVFMSMENKHGEYFVRRALGYLTASKSGLSQLELEDIMSLDDRLLNEVFINNNEYPHLRRMPSYFWSRLRHDLAPYLFQQECDGISTWRWKHQIMATHAASRYLPDDNDKTIELYSNMADYYLGTWGGNERKPFKHPTVLMAKYKLVERHAECCRHVPQQPLMLGENVFNNRKLTQLPYLLINSERTEDLTCHVLCNYEWIYGRLKQSSIQRLITDFEIHDDREVKLVRDALRMSKSALSVNRDALGTELTGRLLPHIHKHPNIKNLIRQCDLDAQRCCPLVANCQIYSAPGGPLQYECNVGANSSTQIDIDVFKSSDGIILAAKPSYSNRLRLWELTNGDERPDVMLPLGDVKSTKNGRFINIFVGDNMVKTYRTESGALHGEIEYGPGKISSSKVSNKFLAFVLLKGSGPYIIDIERNEVLHKFKYHTHAVAISGCENYVAFNAERSILLYELPVMEKRCVATASDVAHDILFINELPKCYVMTKTKLIESITFDVINRKFKSKSILTDMNAKECILSNTKNLVVVRCDKTLHVIDTVLDKVKARFQKLPPGFFVDSSSTFSGAGFTPNDRMIVATRYTYLIVWDADTCVPMRVLQTAVSPMTKLFTSDSIDKVVTLLQNNSFQVWDLDNLDRDIEHSSEVHQGAVTSLAVSSATEYILSHDDKTPDAKIVCLASGTVVDTLQHSENTGDRLVDVIMSPDGLYAVTRAKLLHTDALSNMTFEPLTDDVMWEVETASKVFHAISNRYIVFSPSSETAAFVTCAFYNSCDWRENIYNVFIVHPETSSNYAMDFPYHTEFVAPPKIVSKLDDNFFVAVVQTCKRNVDNVTNKETSRWNEVRLLIQKLNTNANPCEQELLRVQNLVKEVGDDDQFLDVLAVTDDNVLAVYAKGVGSYEFVTDKGIVPPKYIRKGAILLDIESQIVLKHIPCFMEAGSRIDNLQFSSQYSMIIDDDLRIFNYESSSFHSQSTSCKLYPGSAKFVMDGRYIVGISDNQRDIIVVRTSDDKNVGSLFVHGKATCIRVADDDRTVVVGCEDGRVMVLSVILEFADPLREHIEKLATRCEEPEENDLINNDIRRLSLSTPDQHRLSARLRTAHIAEERKPPPYTTLERAVTISRMSNRDRDVTPCIQQ
ncbi:NACHT and WD repeat domain-containing protein 2 [Mactra antiquata]